MPAPVKIALALLGTLVAVFVAIATTSAVRAPTPEPGNFEPIVVDPISTGIPQNANKQNTTKQVPKTDFSGGKDRSRPTSDRGRDDQRDDDDDDFERSNPEPRDLDDADDHDDA